MFGCVFSGFILYISILEVCVTSQVDEKGGIACKKHVGQKYYFQLYMQLSVDSNYNIGQYEKRSDSFHYQLC